MMPGATSTSAGGPTQRSPSKSWLFGQSLPSNDGKPKRSNSDMKKYKNNLALMWEKHQGKPWSFYFMIVSFVLLLVNLYITRSSYQVAKSQASYRFTDIEELESQNSLFDGNSGDVAFEGKRNTPSPIRGAKSGNAASAPQDESNDGTQDYGEKEEVYPQANDESNNESEGEEEEDDDKQGGNFFNQLTFEASQGGSLDGSFPSLVDLPDDQLFENWEEYDAAPNIFVPNSPYKKTEWWGVRAYLKAYREKPVKRFIPVLKKDIQINMQTFNERFRKMGQPILFRFDNLRAAGLKMKAWTFEDLRKQFPYEQNMDGKTFSQYKPNQRVDGPIDLGPGLAAIKDDGKIVRKNGLRNIPRNTRIKEDALDQLGVQWPPLVPKRWRQRPSLWMGTSTSGTAFHSDCCDNHIGMIAGTKRITLAPPSDFHLLKPRCVGKNQGLCYANIPEPNKPGVSSKHYNKMIVDVKPGELLYLPAGWFHHIENLGPTLMVNFWTHGPVHGCMLAASGRNP